MKHLIYYTAQDCPARYAFQLLEGKWKLPCLYVLCENGTLRYGELRTALGVSSMVLTTTLKELESSGLVLRIQYAEIPPRVEYSLSETGAKLIPILHEFSQWGEYLITSQKEQDQ